MKKSSFPTPQDAESAFYEALETGNLEAMMEVWAEDEEIVCVHPGGARIAGYEQVRESWAKMMSSGQRLKVQITDQVVVQGMMISIHSLHEHVAMANDAARQRPVVATNVYLRTGGGWRMIAHHASPAPQAARPSAAETPKTLH